jgi:cytochrome c oxidase subunit 4
MSDSAADIKKHVRVYIIVFISLAILTVLTVGASYIETNMTITVTLALFIATIKASLVACFFMHLISERKLIYSILIATGVFFFAMMFLVLTAYYDRLT